MRGRSYLTRFYEASFFFYVDPSVEMLMRFDCWIRGACWDQRRCSFHTASVRPNEHSTRARRFNFKYMNI